MAETTNVAQKPEVPRTFADVYDDVRLVEESTKMVEVLRRCVENILSSSVDSQQKRDLMMQCIREFFEELDEVEEAK